MKRNPASELPVAGLVICTLLSGCAAIVGPSPKSVTVTEDLRFTWRPPPPQASGITPDRSERETAISAGRYVIEREDGMWEFYASPSGLVAVGKPGENAEKVRGGIGVDRYNKVIYVWRDGGVSYAEPFPVAPGVASPQHSLGEPVYAYAGEIPKELLSKLVFE